MRILREKQPGGRITRVRKQGTVCFSRYRVAYNGRNEQTVENQGQPPWAELVTALPPNTGPAIREAFGLHLVAVRSWEAELRQFFVRGL
jgi:hypothetical protein